MSLTQLACKAASDASKAILEVYASADFEVEMKGDNSPLTLADRKGNDAIMLHLEKESIPVLSEEGRDIPYEERKAWSQLWIVDPLDGTKEFVKRNGEFTVNIALIENGIPVMGVVWVPVLEEVFVGHTDHGAIKVEAGKLESILTESYSSEDAFFAGMRSLNPKELPSEQPEVFTVVGSRSHMSDETLAYMKEKETEHGKVEIISKGSSLKLCMVAEGLANEYPRFAPTMEWDTAAGQAVCMAANCEVLRYPEMNPLTYNRQELLNPWFLVRRS